MDWTFKLGDLAIIVATLLGPVLAVQAQKVLERRRIVNDRRAAIFRVLMATRANRLSPGHVEALNAVPVEYYGRGKKLKSIVDDWHAYLDTLANRELTGQVLGEKRNNAFIDLLHKMSVFLGYDFNRSDIQKDVYYPEGHAVIEADQEIIRRGFAKILSGETAIPMDVRSFPADPTIIQNQVALQRSLLEWLDGKRVVKVRPESGEDKP